MKALYILIFASACFTACNKSSNTTPAPASFSLKFTVNGANNGTVIYNNLNTTPLIRFSFSSPVQASGVASTSNLPLNLSPAPN